MDKLVKTKSHSVFRASSKLLVLLLALSISSNAGAWSFGSKQQKPHEEPASTRDVKQSKTTASTYESHPPESGLTQSDSSIAPVASQGSSSAAGSSSSKSAADGGGTSNRTVPNANELTVADFQALAVSSSELPNLRLVSGHILRGGQPTNQGFAALKQAGVKTIINLRNEPNEIESEKKSVESLGIKYISIPMYPFEYVTVSQFQMFLNSVAAVDSGPVYVHCQFGRDRTGTMIGAYRIVMENWTFDNAFKEMMACGFRPGLAQMTRGLHDLAVSRGDKSPLPSASFVVSDLKSRFFKPRTSAPNQDAPDSSRDSDGLFPYRR